MSEDNEQAAYQAIIRRVDPAAAYKRHWPLRGGISAQMTAVAYRDNNGRAQTVIVRHPAEWVSEHFPHSAQHEFDVLAAIHEAGILSPRPYFHDESGEIFPSPYLVLEYLEGAPVFTTDDTPGYARQVARELARIHAIDPNRPKLRDLPQHTNRLNESILGDTELDESIGQGRILDALRPVWPLPVVNAPVVLHRDIWPGNLIWRDGRLVGVIDWEDAAIGDPMSDVSVARLDLLWAFGWPMVEAFTDAYREFSTTDMSQMPWWDLVAAARPAHELSAWATAWPVVGRSDLSSTTMRRDLHQFADQALAAVARLPQA